MSEEQHRTGPGTAGQNAQPDGVIEHTGDGGDEPAPPDPTAGQSDDRPTTEGIIEHTGDEGDDKRDDKGKEDDPKS